MIIEGTLSCPKDFFPKKGKYKTLISYQKSVIIYDTTYIFCERFFRKYDRTIDQMVQAARSGKQNIIEGAKAAVTSAETELKLTNVARASLEELLEDYHDYLRVHELALWAKDSKEATYVRKLSSGKILPPKLNESKGTYESDVRSKFSDNSSHDAVHKAHLAHHSHNLSPIHQTFIHFLKTRLPEVCANIMICLINQCNFLLDRQIKKLENDFVNEGGIRKKMYNARKNHRNEC